MKSMYNILIADDEDIEREALKLFLHNSSLPIATICEAENGREVLDICKSKKIDIILLDIRMPVLSGLDTLERLREEGNRSKVIISTAYSMFDYAVRALQAGASDFLVKPVEEELFISSLEKVIDRLKEEEKKEEGLERMKDYLNVPKEQINIDSSAPLSTKETVKQICAYIEANYSKRIGLEEIAADSGYSKFHINKIFRSQMDTTVVDYLIHFRMEKAKELLAFTKESVKNVAFRVGYSDPNYFNWTFRKQVGVSPLQYRADAIKNGYSN